MPLNKKSRHALIAVILGTLYFSPSQASILVYENTFDNQASLNDWSTQAFDPEGWSIDNGTLFHNFSDGESDPVAYVYNGTPEINGLTNYRVEVDVRMENSSNGSAGHAGIVVGHEAGERADVFAIQASQDKVQFYDYKNIGFTRDGTDNLHVTSITDNGLTPLLGEWYKVILDVSLSDQVVSYTIMDEALNSITNSINGQTTPDSGALGINNTGQFGVLGFTRSQVRFDNFRIYDLSSPSTVPVPGAIWLLLIGCFGLISRQSLFGALSRKASI